MNNRKAIRNKIKDVLLNDAGVTITNIETNRIKPVQTTDLPKILIYGRQESVTQDEELPSRRTAQISVEILAAPGPALDDDLDDIAQTLETALEKKFRLDGLVYRLFETGTQIQIVHEGKIDLGSLTLNYECNYNTIRSE